MRTTIRERLGVAAALAVSCGRMPMTAEPGNGLQARVAEIVLADHIIVLLLGEVVAL